MRLGLIGSTGHWQMYAPALERVKGLSLVAVASCGPAETLGAFDHAPGLSPTIKRYTEPNAMLDAGGLDVVQICCRADLQPTWVRECLDRKIPVMAEKPLAMDLKTLVNLYQHATKSHVPLVPMHSMRGVPELAAVREAVRAGEIGRPLLSFSQKTYKWGKARPDAYRSRATFPGIAPWVGIHAFDWLYWILGDTFTEVVGRSGEVGRQEYPGCETQAAYLFSASDGSVSTVALDFLRPEAAGSHGDERLRVAGTKGVIEMALIDRKVTLSTNDRPPRPLNTRPQMDIFTQFARSIQGDGPPPIGLEEGFRITEIALKAQQATETRGAISLGDSPYSNRHAK